MKLTIELSTGKKFELTPAEFNELLAQLFNRFPTYYHQVWPNYMPNEPTVWPFKYTYSGSTTG
jgi:hypothetical protein